MNDNEQAADIKPYPKRISFFANKYCRLIGEEAIASFIGRDAIHLLSALVMIEDGIFDKAKPVPIWNEQLKKWTGMSVSTIKRARDRAANAGWLFYVPGRPSKKGAKDSAVRGTAPQYSVTIPRDFTPTTPKGTSVLSELTGGGSAQGEPRESVPCEPTSVQGEPTLGSGRATFLPSSPSSPLKTKTPSESCSEPGKAPASEPPLMTFPVVGTQKKKTWDLKQEKYREYVESFPGVDVLAQLRVARQWAEDNPKKRKTPAGMPKFLCSWLTREQESSGSQRSASRSPARLEPKPGIYGNKRDFISNEPTKPGNEVSPPEAVAEVSNLAPIPEPLNTPEFAAAWSRWTIDLRNRGIDPMTAEGERAQLARLVKIGPDAAIECIETSIANGWKGLFPENEKTPGNGYQSHDDRVLAALAGPYDNPPARRGYVTADDRWAQMISGQDVEQLPKELPAKDEIPF